MFKREDGCGGDCVQRRGVIDSYDDIDFLSVIVDTLKPGTADDAAPGTRQQPDSPPDDARRVLESIYRIGDPGGFLMAAGECPPGCYRKLPADAVARSERTEPRRWKSF